jgi:hypothetical protein
MQVNSWQPKEEKERERERGIPQTDSSNEQWESTTLFLQDAGKRATGRRREDKVLGMLGPSLMWHAYMGHEP